MCIRDSRGAAPIQWAVKNGDEVSGVTIMKMDEGLDTGDMLTKVEVPQMCIRDSAWSQEEMKNFIEEHQIPCPSCGKHNFTDIRQFNLMFKTFQGVTELSLIHI